VCLAQQPQHRLLIRRVERRGRLVEQQQVRRGDQRAGDVDALLLPAEKRTG
jgi:hypothetical protein